MSYEPIYTKPYADGWKDSPSTETPVKAENLNAIDDAIIKIEAFLKDLDLSSFGKEYALLSEAGYSLDLSMDDYYVLTISLKNKAGTVLSSKSVDLPIESMIIDVDYADGVLTLTLQNGNTVDVSIIDIVSGLVPDTRTIAGLDLKDDITAEELKTALDIYDNTVMGGELKPWLYDTSGVEIIVGVYEGKPLYRKLVVLQTPTTEFAYTEVEHGITDVDRIWIDFNHSYTFTPTGDKIPLNAIRPADATQIHGGMSTWVIPRTETVAMVVGGSMVSKEIYIIFEYTKATDAEGSGDSLNPYGIYSAKLDDFESTRNLKTYTNLKQIGMSIDNTIDEVMAALPNNSELQIGIAKTTSIFTSSLPFTFAGGLTLTKYNYGERGEAKIYNSEKNVTHTCGYFSNKFGSWVRISSDLEGTVLWVTTDTSAEFAAQTITLSEDISNYEYYEIEYCRACSTSTNISIRFRTGKIKTSMKTRLTLADVYNRFRQISAPSGTSMEILDCNYYATYGATDTAVDNTWLIPVRVIGYKKL